jgi:DNA-binding IclR family transcriptional regulator
MPYACGNSIEQNAILLSGTMMPIGSSTTIPSPSGSDLESVDLTLRMIELLATSRSPRGVTDVARDLGISKPRAHRHLRALVQRGYARQDPRTEGYEVGIRVLALGEMVRDRFDLVTAVRPVMNALSQTTGMAVTLCGLVEEAVTVLDMIHGPTLIEFTTRPGARLDFHASAHGLVALAFGPPSLTDALLAHPVKQWTSSTLTAPEDIRRAIDMVRRQGWATAVDAVQIGLNALAAPIFDHRGEWRGSIALVGASETIPRIPNLQMIDVITNAAESASRQLGWRGF